jgi:hypothetical protein
MKKRTTRADAKAMASLRILFSISSENREAKRGKK